MKTMKQLGTMTRAMILGGALAAVGCSAAPGTTGNGNGNGGGTTDGTGGAHPTPGVGGGLPGLTPPGATSPTTPPSSSATPKEFCTALGAWLTKCGATPAASAEATCESSYQKYSAPQIAASEACLTKQTTCDNSALSACLGQAVGQTQGTDAGAPPPSGQTCQQCVQAQCSAQVTGCQNNPDCVALYGCMQNAKTQQDALACENQSPNGVTDLQTLLACVTGPCGNVCK